MQSCLKFIFSSSTSRVEGYLHIVSKSDVPLASLHIDRFGHVDNVYAKVAEKKVNGQ